MNTEYVAWFVILVAVGVAAVAYLAFGPVPEIPAAEPGDVPEPWSPLAPDPAGGDVASTSAPAAESSPVGTTEPGPSAPSGTSATP